MRYKLLSALCLFTALSFSAVHAKAFAEPRPDNVPDGACWITLAPDHGPTQECESHGIDYRKLGSSPEFLEAKDAVHFPVGKGFSILNCKAKATPEEIRNFWTHAKEQSLLAKEMNVARFYVMNRSKLKLPASTPPPPTPVAENTPPPFSISPKEEVNNLRNVNEKVGQVLTTAESFDDKLGKQQEQINQFQEQVDSTIIFAGRKTIGWTILAVILLVVLVGRVAYKRGYNNGYHRGRSSRNVREVSHAETTIEREVSSPA